MVLSRAVNGDYSGQVVVKTAALWHGPEADKFKWVEFIAHRKKYDSNEIKRVVQLENSSEQSMGKSIAKGIVGGVLFGGVGAVAGAVSGGKKNLVKYGIEFNDGCKVIIENTPDDPSLQCLVLYARKENILEQNLGF